MHPVACPACGHQNLPHATFCDQCAARMAPTLAPAPARTIRIGAASDNDVVLDYPMVSGYHARVTICDGAAVIEDLGSTNGTAVGSPNNRVRSSPLMPGDTVFFGSFRVPADRLLARDRPQSNPFTVLAFPGASLVLGRDPACDHVLDYPMISWRHAALRREGDAVVVEDLGSTNGTYVNGRRIAGRQRVGPGDVIGLGSYSFQLTPGGGIVKRDERGHLTIEARNVAVDVPGRRLLDRVSLAIYPTEIVGLMGPSGAGKSTLMNALNGYTPPAVGSVLLNGQSLYANYARFRGHLGYVPQDDIMHRDLTVGQALYYTARLRLPTDYTERAIRARVTHVLGQLGLDGTENVLIGSPEKKGISGGQRKRVNLAMELLTDPSVLFLDEPTSGLSSEDTIMVMRLLRELADSGKAILLTIHQPSLEAFRTMDCLVVLGKDRGSPEPARLAYFGPAYPDSIEFFNPEGTPGGTPTPEDVLSGLARGATEEWVRRYSASRYRKEFVVDRMLAGPGESAGRVTPKLTRSPGVSQWWTLVRRSLAIKARDTWNTAILLAQAPIIAGLIVLIFGKAATGEADAEHWPSVATAVATTSFLLTVSALWLGCSNAAREIVGEWAVYHRERMVNLKIPSYVGSKLTVLGATCLLQCAILLGIVHAGCGLKASWVALYVVLALASLVGLAIGLTLSALARTSEVAIALVPIILLPMIFLGGMLQPVHDMGVPAKVLAATVASRWAFEGILLREAASRPTWTPPVLTVPGAIPGPGANAPRIEAPVERDMAEQFFPKKDRKGTIRSVAALALMLLVLVAGIAAILRMRDVH